MNAAEFVWRPSEADIREANWTKFIRHCGVADYATLAARAESEPEWFWNALIEYLDFRFYRPYDKVLDLSEGLAFPRWCVGGTTNIVLNALDKKTLVERARTAVIWESESGDVREWSYAELDAEVCRVASALTALGLKKGDVVAHFMPAAPEAIAALLGIMKIGCIVTPLFSGYGAEALAVRLREVGARAVVTADGTWRRGQQLNFKRVLDEAAAQLSGIEHVIVFKRLGTDVQMQRGRDHWWHELCAAQPSTFPTTPVEAEHPALVIFTSGTTGKPKGIVHTHCGLAIKSAQDTQLCWNFKHDSRVLFMADFGWLSGTNGAVGCAMAGAAFLLVEGVPDFPQPTRYWRLIQDQRISIVGVTPTLTRLLRRHGDAETDKCDFSSLKIIFTSGEPCDTDTWMWMHEHLGRSKLPILNLSGGTEMLGITASNLLMNIKPGSLNGGIPGTGADIVDASGKSVGPGEIGELVMRSACIGTTRGLWKDRERYLESYWSQIPGMWVQGDLASRDADGLWYLHGRSDDTIKVSGKRTGPAEVEQLLIGTHLVSEAAVVGVPDPLKGSALICVVIPSPGEQPGEALAAKLSDAVVKGMGNSFRPSRVLFVRDLPRTRNMKVMRRGVRAALTGAPVGDTSSLLNPEVIEELRGLAM